MLGGGSYEATTCPECGGIWSLQDDECSECGCKIP